MNKNKNRETVFIRVLAATAAVLLVLVGWQIFNLVQKIQQDARTTAIQAAQPKLYLDTAERFTFRYPNTWSLAYAASKATDDPAPTSPDWAKTSRPVEVQPNEGKVGNKITVTPGCTSARIADLKARKDRFHTQEDLKINGYTAFYDKLNFKTDAERYVHHTYIVLNGKDCLEFSYRESHHHPMSNTNFDDQKNVKYFKMIVGSVKFAR
ncbi:MAG TPA: hypothetical protein VFZ48_04130 [Candidatus Saccharimonadales bacterium]